MNEKTTECNACGKEVSKKAPVCPHCGQKYPGFSPAARKRALKILGVIGAFMALVIFIGTRPVPKERQAEALASYYKELLGSIEPIDAAIAPVLDESTSPVDRVVAARHAEEARGELLARIDQVAVPRFSDEAASKAVQEAKTELFLAASSKLDMAKTMISAASNPSQIMVMAADTKEQGEAYHGACVRALTKIYTACQLLKLPMETLDSPSSKKPDHS